jgi:ferredoxin
MSAGLSRVRSVRTYVIAEPCIDVKDLSCVDVCPVDCIHEANRILVIDPEECIDSAACEPECPVEAIFPEDALPEKWGAFVKINYACSEGLARIDQLVNELRGEDDEHPASAGRPSRERLEGRLSQRSGI